MQYVIPMGSRNGAGKIGRFSRGMAVASVLTVCLASGCSHLGPAEKESLTQASQAYGRGDLTGASTRLDRLITDFDSTMEIGEAYYLRGLCRAKGKQYGLAAKDLETAIKKSKREDLTLNAKVSLASLAFQRGAWDQAVDYYEEVLPHMPPAPPKDEVLYTAGLAMQRVGKWKGASLCFSQILSRFRDRPVAAEARRKAAWPHPYFSIQLGAFRDTGNAAKLVQTCRSRSLDATQESLPMQGQAMWVVMAGRYRTYAEAYEALQNVRKSQSNATIVP